MEPKVAQTFGKYEIIAELGRGGMGVVYKARDPLIGRLVALKTLSPEVLSAPDLLKRFSREAQSAGNLQHPNVVTIYELGEVSGLPYIAMELVEGETLAQIISRQAPMPLAKKLSIIGQFCQGLGHAHQHGVTHRDVKPANILVKNDGVVKVVDFGIAHLELAAMTRSGMFVGTVHYSSPEQINNVKLDSRSDIFAAGVVIYEFLTYTRPFDGPNIAAVFNQVLNKEPAPLRQFVPDIPAELEAIVTRCMRKDPDERYQTLEEMLLELDPLAESVQQKFAQQFVSQVPELIARRDFSRAREILLDVLTFDRSHSLAKNLLAEVNAEIRRQEASIKIADCLTRGQASLQKGDYQGAVQIFEEAVKFDSKHEQARSLLAMARGELERIAEVNKQLATGKNAYRSGDLTDAETSLSKVLALDQNNPEAQVLLLQIQKERAERERRFRLQEGLWHCRSLLAANFFEQAYEKLVQLQNEFPAEAEVQQLLAEARPKSEALRKEVEVIKTCLTTKRFREGFDRAGALASRFPGRGDLVELYQTARSQHETMERRLREDLRQVRNLLQEDLCEQALQSLLDLQKEFSNDASVQQLLQETREKAEELRRGIEAAKAFLEANRFREADERASALAAKFPRRADLAQLSQAARSQYEAAERRRELESGVEKIRSLIKGKDYAGAIDRCRLLHQKFPGNPAVQQLLAQAESEKQAADLERQIVETSQPIRALLNAGRHDEAAAQAEQALARFPGNADLERLLVNAREHQCAARFKTIKSLYDAANFGEAVREAQSALQQFPDNSELRKLLNAATEQRAKQEESPIVSATSIFHVQDFAREAQPDAGFSLHPEGYSSAPPVAVPEVEPPTPGVEAQPAEHVAARGKGRKPYFLGAVSVVLLVILAITGVLLTRRKGRELPLVQFEILTSPSGATIAIDGKALGKTPLKHNMPLGLHKLEASLEGYQPASSSLTLAVGVPASVSLVLQPLSSSLHVFTDLESGEVRLEGKAVAKLQDGQFAMDQFDPGKHTLQVASNGQTAALDFETAPGTAPAVARATASRNLSVIAVSSLGGHIRIFSSSKTLQVGVDGQSPQPVGPDGLALDVQTLGSHEFTIAQGTEQQKKMSEISAAPALTVYLSSNRNVGTLVVLTDPDDAQVSLDGKSLRRLTGSGALRVLNLAPKKYVVAVTKDGYETVASQIAEIRKGEETTLTFNMKPVARMAGLLIQGAAADAEVLLDGKPVGIVGPDGTFSAPNIALGEHTIELRKSGFRPKLLRHQFVTGQTETIKGDQEQELGTLVINVLPPVKDLTLRREGGANGIPLTPGRRDLPAGSYTVTARWSSGREMTQSVQIVAGGTLPVDLKLNSMGMEGWQNPKEWAAQGKWYVHQGGGVSLFKATPTSGSFVFTGRVRKGERLAWVLNYTDQSNYLLFEIDSKTFSRKEVVGGKTRELSRSPSLVGKSEYCSLRIDVMPGSVVHQIVNNKQLVPVDTWKDSARDFSRGKFGFLIPSNRTMAISNFGFSPQ